MGSLDRAVLTGFICRLCSEMHRVVIHIYGDEGTNSLVSQKISKYLSINVSKSDPLPKTICQSCLDRLEGQHRLVLVMEHASSVLKQQEIDRAKALTEKNSEKNSENNNKHDPAP